MTKKRKCTAKRGGVHEGDFIGIQLQAVSKVRKQMDAGPIGVNIYVAVPGRRTLEVSGHEIGWNALTFLGALTDTLKRIEPCDKPIVICSRIPQIRKMFDQSGKLGGRSPHKHYTAYWKTKVRETWGMLNGPFEGAWEFKFRKNMMPGFRAAEDQYSPFRAACDWEHGGLIIDWPKDWPRVTDTQPERVALARMDKELEECFS